MRQYISNEKYELIKDNLDSKDTYVVVDGENVDKVAFVTNNITGENVKYEVTDNSAEIEELEEQVEELEGQVEKLEQVTNHPSYITKMSWDGDVNVVPFAQDDIYISAWGIDSSTGKAKLTITFKIKNTQYKAFTFDGYKNNLIYYNNNGYTFTPNWISENKTTGDLVGEFLADLNNDKYLEVMAAGDIMITIIFNQL